MPYANNQGANIHYQVSGEGSPLILLHGFNGSSMDWYEFGYVEKLQDKYQLILVDARVHGASDKPHDPKLYTLDQLVADITAVLDNLNILTAHYLGYSMGGWIGFGMAKYAHHRLNSMIIGGAQPYGRNFDQIRELLSTGLEDWMAVVEDWGIYSTGALERMRNNDAKALLAVIQDRPDISNILSSMTIPCLLYAGSADNQHDLMERCAKELPNTTLISLPGLDHIGVFPRSDLVVPHIIQFLASL